MELTAGQNVPAGAAMQVRLHQAGLAEVDLIALLLDRADQVQTDDDFVFYNAPRHPCGGVVLVGQELTLQTHLLPASVERVLIAANSDEQFDGLTVSIGGQPDLSFAPSQLAGLPTAVMLEVYRRDTGWRVRAVGQGWAGLAGLARDYGVNVEGDQASEPPFPAERVSDPAPAQSEIDALLRSRDSLVQEIAALELQVRKAREAIVETDELRLLQQVGYYQFRHPLDDVLSSKERLDALRSGIKKSISKRTAVHGKSGWMVNGSLKEGAALVRQFGDLMLRTYNIEADNCVRTVRAHTVDTARKRLDRTREAIVDNGSTMGVAIDDAYHALRLEELQLTADHHLRVEQEEGERARGAPAAARGSQGPGGVQETEEGSPQRTDPLSEPAGSVSCKRG